MKSRLSDFKFRNFYNLQIIIYIFLVGCSIQNSSKRMKSSFRDMNEETFIKIGARKMNCKICYKDEYGNFKSYVDGYEKNGRYFFKYEGKYNLMTEQNDGNFIFKQVSINELYKTIINNSINSAFDYFKTEREKKEREAIIEKERLEKERRIRIEKERKERLEKERRIRIEKERRERLEKERRIKIEKERRERLEKQRIELEKAEIKRKLKDLAILFSMMTGGLYISVKLMPVLFNIMCKILPIIYNLFLGVLKIAIKTLIRTLLICLISFSVMLVIHLIKKSNILENIKEYLITTFFKKRRNNKIKIQPKLNINKHLKIGSLLKTKIKL
ncbi:MAG: hypothetical protein GY830_08360 [Bacteroidetes bacterium]|nr:hypothetical protein [Bacteroidota bacterium]